MAYKSRKKVMNYIVSVTSDGLNLRASPGMRGYSKTELDHGAILVVSDSKKVGNTNWLLVDAGDDGHGWVSEKYTEPYTKTQPAPEPCPTPEYLPDPEPVIVTQPQPPRWALPAVYLIGAVAFFCLLYGLYHVFFYTV